MASCSRGRRSSARRCSSPRRTSAFSAAVRVPITPMRCAAFSSAPARRGPRPSSCSRHRVACACTKRTPRSTRLRARWRRCSICARRERACWRSASATSSADRRCSPAPRIALRSFPEPGSVFPDPRVIEMAHGRGELDADDDAAITALFGAEARAAAGEIDLVADDATIVRAWIASALRDDSTFAERVRATQVHLATRLFGRDLRRAAADARRAPAEPLRRGCSPTRSRWRRTRRFGR